MNISDSERVATVLGKLGYKETLKIGQADLIVVNMCSVRQSAVDRILGLGKKIENHKVNKPNLKTILTGCFLTKDKTKLFKIFEYILPINKINKLTKILKKGSKVKKNYLDIKPTYFNKFSAIIPIMTGCNNFCTYCVVPYTRGPEISRPAKQIISEIKNLIKKGYKEIWLMGQNVNSYKDGKTNFPKLLKIIDSISGDFWIRFTSSHPKNFSEKLIDVMEKCKKITPYLNLPVQAGSNKILKKMNRPYSIKEYMIMLKRVREKIPNITISTDIIVGFPGETKKDFKDSLNLFRSSKYDMAYISEYSARSGTVALGMNDDVTKEEKTKRKFLLNEILKKTAQEKNNKYIGKTISALIDRKGRGKNWVGKTRGYKTIVLTSNKNLMGKFIKAKIVEASPWGLKGKLL